MSGEATKMQGQICRTQESPQRLLQLQEHRGPFGGERAITSPAASLWDSVPAVQSVGPGICHITREHV